MSENTKSAVPTKLGRLQQVMNAAQGAADAPTMTDEHTSPSTPASPRSLSDIVKSQAAIQAAPDVKPDLSMPESPSIPPADLAQSIAADAKAPTPTWREAHPGLARLLNVSLGAAKGAAAGTGATTFGEGFQRAQELPIEIATRKEDLAAKRAATAHTQAVTEQLKTQVTLPNGLTVPFALAQKLYPTLTTEQGKNTRAQAALDSKEAIALRNKGLRLDESGKTVPIPYEELSPAEQAAADLKKSQKDALDARAAYDKFRANPNSEQYKLARERLRIAAQNASTAAGRLGLEGNKYVADYLGLDANGAPLPGVPMDDQGRAIGPRVANAGKIPADRLKRGDLAANAIGNLDDIAMMVQDNPDLFGALAGRITTMREMIGSDNEVIRQIAIAAHNYALASNGAHGVRSQGAVEKTEQEILNHFKDGPDAILGGIKQAQKSLRDFVEDQKLGNRARPSGNASQPKATHTYNPSTGKIEPITQRK